VKLRLTLRKLLVEGVAHSWQMREQECDEKNRHAEDGAHPEAPLPRPDLFLRVRLAWFLTHDSYR
jgi:hypothetical protein